MGIHENIKKYRKLNDLTQKELAEKIGVSTITIQNYENSRRTPNYETLTKIANALHISINDLFLSDINLSKKILDYLEDPIIKSVGPYDTLEVISEDFNIDYKLLESCINENNELPEEVQEILLEFLSKIDYPSFLDFIERYTAEIKKSDRLDKFISELFVAGINDIDKKALEILKSYILLAYGKIILELMDNDVLLELQKEIQKFIDFKLHGVLKEIEENK